MDSGWTPTLTGNFYGAWALATLGTTALFVGGAFTTVSGVAQPHFAEFR